MPGATSIGRALIPPQAAPAAEVVTAAPVAAPAARRSVLEQAGIPAAALRSYEGQLEDVRQGGETARQNIKDLRGQQNVAMKEMEAIPHTPPPKLAELPAPPEQTEPDPIRVFRQTLPAIAMLGGLFVRNNATAALQAGTAAMNAARANDVAALERAHKDWEDNLAVIRARNQDILTQWNAVANDEHATREDKLAVATQLAAQMQSEALSHQIAIGDLGPVYQHFTMLRNAHDALAAQDDRDRQMNEQERHNQQAEANTLARVAAARAHFTESQLNAAVYAGRLAHASPTLLEMEEKGIDPVAVWTGRYGTNDPAVQVYRQAMREFVNATLRRESGAAISPSEFESANLQYFISPLDTPEVLRRKQESRDITLRGLVGASNGAASQMYPEVFGTPATTPVVTTQEASSGSSPDNRLLVTTAQQYETLPSGTWIIDEEGHEGRKP